MTTTAAAPLAHAKQLPLPKLYSAAGRESDSCKRRYNNDVFFNLIIDILTVGQNGGKMA